MAIKSLLYSYLLELLSIYTIKSELTSIKTKKFPLHKVKNQPKKNSRVLYISGVAVGLAKSDHQRGMEIASGIACHLSAIARDVVSVQIVPPGWIYLELTDLFLAAWLQSLVNSGVGRDNERGQGKITIQNQSCLFAIQYAHARCYSLVQLAHGEGLIKLKELTADKSRLFPDQPIPWLEDEQKFRLNHPAEGEVISKLVEVIDNLESPDLSGAVNWEKISLDLSQAFEAFWCQCRILGKKEISSPELAQARLGLIIATQSVLKRLLVNKFGAFAPVEL